MIILKDYGRSGERSCMKIMGCSGIIPQEMWVRGASGPGEGRQEAEGLEQNLAGRVDYKVGGWTFTLDL